MQHCITFVISNLFSMQNDIIDRLRFVINNLRITPNKLAVTAGIDPANFTKMLNGKQKITDKTLGKISQAHGLNINWLRCGEGAMEENSASPLIGPSAGAHMVPLLPVEAYANPLAEFFGEGVRRADCQSIVSQVDADFAIAISGDSMEPKFHDGTIVFLRRINDQSFIPWGNTMVLDTENGAFIKDIFPIDGNDEAIEARSINPKYPVLIIPKHSIYGMYRVMNSTKFYPTM